MKKYRYVILGCGYLGFHLAEYFSSLGNEVIVIGRISYYSQKLRATISFVEADLFDLEQYGKYITENSIVIHATNQINSTNGFKFLEKDVELNYVSFISLINICADRKIKKFVFLSSAGTIYGNATKDTVSEDHPLKPVNIYGLQKMYFESCLRIKMLEYTNFSYVTLRISNPYGGIQNPSKKQGIIPILINKAKAEEKFELWVDRSTIRDFIYIDDLLEATNRVIHKFTASGDEFNVGSGQGTSLDTLINLIENGVGKKIQIVKKSATTTTINSNILNISKLEQVVGFTPQVNIIEGINYLINEMNGNYE